MIGTFPKHLQRFEELLRNKTPFSLSRYGDGELTIMKGVPLDLASKKEFTYDGNTNMQEELLDSFTYQDDSYFVGIGCKCCVGDETYEEYKTLCQQPAENLTWANIFVNGNYNYFLHNIMPLFETFDEVVLVSPGTTERLPFKVSKHFKIGPDVWGKQYNLKEDLVTYTKDKEGALVLLCAGPFANILCKTLHESNNRNTYLDLGSVFNVPLGIGANRGYLQGAATLHKICI